ncbi:MAG: DUF4426 domain-containing protein [Gammaproteobacteria bacterium]
MRTSVSKAISVMIAATALSLVACGSPSDVGSSGEGRTRLSLNKSYAEFGEYVIHINGMASTSLQPFIADRYGIARNENRGVVNLVVLKKTDTVGVNKPVKAVVNMSAANLTGQVKNIAVAEVEDGESIYYLGQISVDHRETINFDIDVRPENGPRVLPVRFTYQFYVD